MVPKQIYLENEQAKRLKRLTLTKGGGESEHIRTALDHYLDEQEAAQAEWRVNWRSMLKDVAGGISEESAKAMSATRSNWRKIEPVFGGNE